MPDPGDRVMGPVVDSDMFVTGLYFSHAPNQQVCWVDDEIGHPSSIWQVRLADLVPEPEVLPQPGERTWAVYHPGMEFTPQSEAISRYTHDRVSGSILMYWSGKHWRADGWQAMEEGLDDAEPGTAYPACIGVFCDRCGVTVEHDYLIPAESTREDRFAIARRHLVANEGWSCGEQDLCPKCQRGGENMPDDEEQLSPEMQKRLEDALKKDLDDALDKSDDK